MGIFSPHVVAVLLIRVLKNCPQFPTAKQLRFDVATERGVLQCNLKTPATTVQIIVRRNNQSLYPKLKIFLGFNFALFLVIVLLHIKFANYHLPPNLTLCNQ